jgi:hypothetical protein
MSGGVTIVKVGGSRPDLQQSLSAQAQQQQVVPTVGTREQLIASSSSRQPVLAQQDVGGCWLNRQEVNRLVINRPRLGGDSRSTGRLHTSIGNRSMTRLNIGKYRFGEFEFQFPKEEYILGNGDSLT